jgi:phospholipid-binding lipoprotein MlaA
MANPSLRRRLRAVALACGLALSLGACAATGPALAPDDADNDPYEGTNRALFSVNSALDSGLFQPVARGYNWLLPDVVRDRIRDALNFVRTPVILANNLLQGDLDGAEHTLGRFFINGILGMGFVDIAAAIGKPPRREDFGQTLAVWGVGEGPFLMLPFLGPSNPRDFAGFIVDIVLNPTFYTQGTAIEIAGYTRQGADILDSRARALVFTDELEKTSVDYYASLRSLYRQQRNDLILNGRPNPTRGIPGLIDD